jgi:hypothetical protein
MKKIRRDGPHVDLRHSRRAVTLFDLQEILEESRRHNGEREIDWLPAVLAVQRVPRRPSPLV